MVIPCKDRQLELDRAVQSVLAQTLRALEIVIIDDGSETPLRVPELPFLRLVRQANAGPAAARNKGAALATGDWIALLDSDDVWFPSKLQEQWDLIQKHSAEFCFGNMDMSSWGIKLDYSSWIDDGSSAGLCSHPLDQLVKGCYIPTSTILVRREVFEKVRGFDCQLKFYEDYDLTLRLANHVKVAITNKDVGSYIRCGDSFGRLAKEPIGLEAEAQVLGKVACDATYAPRIRKAAQQRIGEVLFDLAYLHRKRGHPRLCAITTLRAIAHKNRASVKDLKNLLFCFPESLRNRNEAANS